MRTTEPHAEPDWFSLGRRVRERYDGWRQNQRGDCARLRRCTSALEVQMEGAFWRLVADVPQERRAEMAPLVLCFACCGSLGEEKGGFRFGHYLRNGLARDRKLDDAKVTRFRQLLAAREPDEFHHRLRRLLTHIKTPLDWGVLTRDVIRWGGGRYQNPAWRDEVCRQWAQDFYDERFHEADEAVEAEADQTTQTTEGEHS